MSNIGIDIRPLMTPNRTGVGEYTVELLNAVFALDKTNQYFLFYNSHKDVSANIPKWKQENVRIVATHYPNKLFNAGIKFFGRPKLDRLSFPRRRESSRGNIPAKVGTLIEAKDSCFRRNDSVDSRFRGNDRLDIFFSPNLNFTSISLNTKFVLTIHDLSFEFFPEYFSLKQRLWHRAVNPKKQCRRADLILTPSENTKRDIVNYYKISPDKIHVIYPGLSPMFSNIKNDTGCHPERSPEPRFSGSGRSEGSPEYLGMFRYAQHDSEQFFENYILFLGTVENRKNIIGLIKAFEIFNTRLTPPRPPQGGISLIIAGSPGYGYEQIQKYAENSPCKDKIKLIGYIDAEDKPALYANAKLFVYPSFYEGFGFPILEAMAAGVPVITSNRSSLTEITGPTAYLINPNNPIETAAAISQIINSPSLQAEQIKNGLIRAAEFSWQKSAERWLNIIQAIV